MTPNQILSFLKDVSILCGTSSLKCLHSRVVMTFLFFNTAPCAMQEGPAKPIRKTIGSLFINSSPLSLILICILPLKAKSRTRSWLVFISCLPNGTLCYCSTDQYHKMSLSYDDLMTLFGSLLFPRLHFSSIKLKIKVKVVFVFLIELLLN